MQGKFALIAAAAVAALASLSPAAAITSGDLVVYRVGDGSAALSSAATAVFLDEYTPAGTLVQSIALPSGSGQALTASGTASSEGLLTASGDGKYLAVTGYNAAAGTASVKGTTSAAVNRTVGVIATGTGTVGYTNLTDASTGDNIRSAYTADGTNLYVAGAAGGVRYATAGGTTSTQLSTTTTNLRQVLVAGGQLYASSSSGTTRVATVGSGTPTTAGQTIANLNGITSTNAPSPYGLFFADLNAGVAGVDTLYVADSTNGIEKFAFDGTTWTLAGTVADAGVTGVTGTVVNGVVSLFATTPTTLALLTDTGGAGGVLSGTLTNLASAGTNTAFRGVGYVAATPEPASLAVLGLAGLLGLRRRRA